MGVPREHLAQVLGLVRPAGPAPFVLGLDGRSGAGKTELAGAVVTSLRERWGPHGAVAVPLEDAYRGWRGLAEGVAEVARGVLEPLSRGERGGYRRYDWSRGRLGEPVPVPAPGASPPRVVVVEGCGAGSAPCAPFLDALVWLEADERVRRERALARDEYSWLALWETWRAQESALLAERDARAAADLVLRTDGPDRDGGAG